MIHLPFLRSWSAFILATSLLCSAGCPGEEPDENEPVPEAPDAGTTATDAGTITTDAGTITADAGTTATDAGTTATDAGTTTADAGTIATDAGTTTTDAGPTTTDAGLADAGVISECADGGLPDAGCGCPSGTFGFACGNSCTCTNGSDCADGPGGDGLCTCLPDTFGSDCSGDCSCDIGGLCDDGATGTGACSDAYAIELAFERIDSGTYSPFLVTVALTNNATPVPGVVLSVAVSQGALGAVSDLGGGAYEFLVTPTQSGEHLVTVGFAGLSVSHTALVFPIVHSDWGQPMSVRGLVNTDGYEDGATITADGEYLFVHYGPAYFSGIFLFSAARINGGCEGNRLEFPAGTPNLCLHPWIDDTIGPITGPARPDFPVGTISGDGTTFIHNAASWGVLENQAPNFALPTAFYGFRRQPDGSFAEPFKFAFDDVEDGLIGPYGMSFVLHGDGTATLAFSFNDPADADLVDFDGDGTDDAESFFDVFTTEVTLGEDKVLGTYVPTGVPGQPPMRGTPFDSTLVNFGKVGIEGIAGTQGNSHLHAPAGVVTSVWVDDEFDTGGDYGELSVHVLQSGSFPGGTWNKTILPSTINRPPPSNEIQPFFLGDGLYFTRLGDGVVPAIRFATYAGTDAAADYADNANWGTPVDILSSGEFVLNGILGLGEPTVATRNGKEILYFIYASVRGFDAVSGLPDLNMQAGYLERR